jgi:hypothetical protein
MEERLIAFAESAAAQTPRQVFPRNAVESGPVSLWDHEREAIREMLEGNPDAISGVRNALRAVVLRGLWQLGVDPRLLVADADRLAFEAMFRGVVAKVWSHDYRETFSVFAQLELRSVFEAARFPIDHLPEKVTIYRGIAVRGSRLPPRSGISWTLRRDLACWFALHLPGSGGSAMFSLPAGWHPYLLTATVRREHVSAHMRDREEDEIIVFGMSARRVSVTSNENDIRAGEARECARRSGS